VVSPTNVLCTYSVYAAITENFQFSCLNIFLKMADYETPNYAIFPAFYCLITSKYSPL